MSTVTFTWNPDPIVMANRVSAVAGSLENRIPPLIAASEAMQADIRERFETETGPDGTPWAAWSKNYLPYAEAYPNIGILRQDGDLAEAASSSEAMVISHDAVFYKTSHLPSYGLAHESGLPNRKSALPARPFLGMSNEAAVVILRSFEEWFDGSINLFATTGGRVGRRHSIRGATGFIPRSAVGKAPLPRLT